MYCLRKGSLLHRLKKDKVCKKSGKKKQYYFSAVYFLRENENVQALSLCQNDCNDLLSL